MIDIMKKVLTFASTLSFLPFAAATAYAQTTTNLLDCNQVGAGFNTLCALSGTNLGSLMGQVITFIFVLAVIIALFFLI